jgi:hypothetical protein
VVRLGKYEEYRTIFFKGASAKARLSVMLKLQHKNTEFKL